MTDKQKVERIWQSADGLSCSVEDCDGDVTHRQGNVLFCRAHMPMTANQPEQEGESVVTPWRVVWSDPRRESWHLERNSARLYMREPQDIADYMTHLERKSRRPEQEGSR